MILQRLADAIRTQNWFTVVLEILIVVVGIFIGLQVDGWNEQRKDRGLEQRYLERIYNELALDIEEFDYGINLAETRRSMGELLLEALEDSGVVRANPLAFLISVEQAGYTFLPAVNDSTYEELKFSGDLAIIRDEQLRASIAAYYRQIEQSAQWGYLREFIQTTYEDRALGILTPAQQRETINMARRIDDPPDPNLPMALGEDEALKALERMRDKQDFIDQITRASNNNTSIGTLGLWRDAAEDLRHRVGVESGRE